MSYNSQISLIVAMSKNGVIGDKDTNDMPWSRLPDDLKYFKEKTLKSVVIMGRKTFDSLGRKPLKDRNNFVITNNKSITNKYLEDSRTLVSLGNDDKAHEEHLEKMNETYGVKTCWISSLDIALGAAKIKNAFDTEIEKNLNSEIFIIGGAAIYKEAKKLSVDNLVTRLYITEIDVEFHGEQYLKFSFDPLIWKEVSRTHHPKDEKHEFAFDFVVYDRVINIIDI